MFSFIALELPIPVLCYPHYVDNIVDNIKTDSHYILNVHNLAVWARYNPLLRTLLSVYPASIS